MMRCSLRCCPKSWTSKDRLVSNASRIDRTRYAPFHASIWRHSFINQLHQRSRHLSSIHIAIEMHLIGSIEQFACTTHQTHFFFQFVTQYSTHARWPSSTTWPSSNTLNPISKSYSSAIRDYHPACSRKKPHNNDRTIIVFSIHFEFILSFIVIIHEHHNLCTIPKNDAIHYKF